MNSPANPDEDRQFSEIFQTLNPPLADHGFADTVMHRIRRRARVRSIMLTTALFVGGVFAVGPLSEIAVLFSDRLLVITTRWNDPSWLMQNWALVAVILMSLIWPSALRWLER